MRTLLIVALLFCSVKAFAQRDYFYAETLIDNGQHAEAVRVLDHLIDSGAYNDRPRFLMMTLNLASSVKSSLGDTIGARKCCESVMAYYDTLSDPQRSDSWNHTEYYRAGRHLAAMDYKSGNYRAANALLITIGYPGQYYAATGSDLVSTQDHHCSLRTKIFQKLNQPDSAFHWICAIRAYESVMVRKLDTIFNDRSNDIRHVRFVPYTSDSANPNLHSPGYLYFVAWSDNENNQHSLWLLNPDRSGCRIIGQSTYNLEDAQNFPANCYDMSLSPDEKYLAVTCYTEGSNFIDIYSFPEILNEKRCVLKQSILAYPSTVEVKGWENSLMIVECDQDLTRLNKKTKPNWDVTPNLDLKMLFLFDPESGKFSKK